MKDFEELYDKDSYEYALCESIKTNFPKNYEIAKELDASNFIIKDCYVEIWKKKSLRDVLFYGESIASLCFIVEEDTSVKNKNISITKDDVKIELPNDESNTLFGIKKEALKNYQNCYYPDSIFAWDIQDRANEKYQCKKSSEEIERDILQKSFFLKILENVEIFTDEYISNLSRKMIMEHIRDNFAEDFITDEVIQELDKIFNIVNPIVGLYYTLKKNISDFDNFHEKKEEGFKGKIDYYSKKFREKLLFFKFRGFLERYYPNFEPTDELYSKWNSIGSILSSASNRTLGVYCYDRAIEERGEIAKIIVSLFNENDEFKKDYTDNPFIPFAKNKSYFSEAHPPTVVKTIENKSYEVNEIIN